MLLVHIIYTKTREVKR